MMFLSAIMLWILLVFASNSFAQFAGGSGTEEDPFQVNTIKQLQFIADSLYLDKHFIQIADIDANETENWNNGAGFEPIGWIITANQKHQFSGSFDGNGFEISGLTINREDENNIGLFGYADLAQIRNVSLINVSITGNRNVGGLIAYNWAVVSESSVTGMVSGGNNVGGMIGSNNMDLIGSHADVTVVGNFNVGGLIGYNDATMDFHLYGFIDNSTAIGNVNGYESVGGLVGRNDGRIYNSSATGDVTGNSIVGGLIGFNTEDNHVPISGEVKYSFATGDVSGENKIGGFAGYNYSIIRNVYSTGSVNGKQQVGGLVGFNKSFGRDSPGIVEFSYSTGKVTADDIAGGLIGSNAREIVGSYWDLETSEMEHGIGEGPELTYTGGLRTDLMTGQNAYHYMNQFDFENTWLLTEGYPALYWEDVDALDLPTSAEMESSVTYYELSQNYPNPFNPVTQIGYVLPEQTHVRLEVYNALGQRVATLVDETRRPGRYEATFDASGLSSGLYLYRLQTATYTESRQMMLIK